MQISNLHKWDLSYKEAVGLQKKLASRVKFTPIKKRPKLVAGLDCAFSKDGKKIISAVVVLNLENFQIVEIVSAVRKLTFPYIPGLLSFREAPVCIAAAKKLKTEPDVFIIDGQGFAHPRRFGLACHLGLFFDKPTIGCAKSRLLGSYEEPPLQKGSVTFLEDKTMPGVKRKGKSSEVIGAVLRTRTNVKPVFVSVGYKCTLRNAIDIVLKCTRGFRLPEPTRLADQIVSRLVSAQMMVKDSL